MKEREPQPAAADIKAPSEIAGDDIGRRTPAPTEDEEPERVEKPSDTGTTRGGGAGGPEPPPV